MTPEAMQLLEQALPARPTLPKFPKNHVVDEVQLEDVDPTRANRMNLDSDDEEDGHGGQGQGVSCQNQ